MCRDAILFDIIVSVITMYSDNPPGMFYMDIIQELVKEEYGLFTS